MASHKLIENIDYAFTSNGCIVEIGSARETSGSDSSTFFFSELAEKTGSEFYSVDFSPNSQKLAAEIIGESAILSDGVAFLKKFKSISSRKISVFYLDNFDVVYNNQHKESLMRRVGNIYEDNNESLTNERSAVVHLEQMKAAIPLLADKHVVIIDDTKQTEVGWWGKGASAVPFLLEKGYSIKAQSEDGILLVCPELQSL